MRQRKRVLVSGRVQGVFFRDTARQRASDAGIAGSARNLKDGRVEVILEGDAEAVAAMIEWCRSGPDYARVEDIEVVDEEPQGTGGFDIT